MALRICNMIACGVLGTAAVTGCTGGPVAPHHVAGHHSVGQLTPPSRLPVTRANARQCPRTTPSHYAHEAMSAGSPSSAGATTFPTKPITAVIVNIGSPGTFAYGNGKLWVTLNRHGVIVPSGDMVSPDGSISWKLPWWRMAGGDLTITGRRLDAPAPPLTSRVPGGYGNIGFQASGVTFPTGGCWQVTGSAAHTSLTFVTLVITNAHRAVLSGTG
jgi:hypothetical protein